MPLLFLVFLLLAPPLAKARPDLERARRLLGSEKFEERRAITRDLWEAGSEALPVLSRLSADDDPEIARRARFVFKKIQLGLEPGAPADLLQLIEAVERSPFEFRSSKLGSLLEHPGGFRAALFFFDQWISTEGTPHEHRLSLSKFFVESLFEQRSDWQQFFAFPLSHESRAYLVAVLAHEDSPLKSQMIAILAARDPKKIHALLTRHFDSLPDEPLTDEIHLVLARLAVARHDPALAHKILAHGLRGGGKSLQLVRALAFLEKTTDLPPATEVGPWLPELNLLRARAAEDLPETIELAERLFDRPLLRYESLLLAGCPTLPDDPDLVLFDGAGALPIWHQAFGAHPEDPDIEALTSSILIAWPQLARTLTALGHPVEAAERLASAGQSDAALTLLWHTGQREKAIELSTDLLIDASDDEKAEIRGTLSSLALESGDRDRAAEFFEPLFHSSIDSPQKRQAAISLGLRIFPLEKVVSLEPDLSAERAFRRQRALAPFFDAPPHVAGFWYEHFRKKNPEERPAPLIRTVREFLRQDDPEARKVMIENLALASSSKSLLLPSDPLYRNNFYLRLPGALEMVEKAAWYQLSTDDLKSIIQSGKWPRATRHRALAIALEIDPIDPVLQYYHVNGHEEGDPGALTLATLGDPSLALALGRLTGKKESLAITARISDFQDPGTLQCLALLGQFHLGNEGNEDPEKAARLLLAALCGEMAMGTRPPAAIRVTLQNLRKLYRARLEMAAGGRAGAREVMLWRGRLEGLGAKGAR